MKIIFFNHFHNGDVHLSRGFVKAIMTAFPEHEYSYAHKNDPNLLADIPNLKHLNNIPCSQHEGVIKINGDIWINTWYGQQSFHYMNQYGITFDTLYSALNAATQTIFNKSLAEIEPNPINLFPSIDYMKLKVDNIHSWLMNHSGKRVLVENSLSLSGQSNNFDMNQVVVKLANKHPSLMFLTSAPIKDCPTNVFYCGDIIKKSGSDLNEISYLSIHCDVVVGRASGIFSFCMTKENLFQRKASFVCFSNLDTPKFWLHDLFDKTIDYHTTITNYTTSDLDKVENIIGYYL